MKKLVAKIVDCPPNNPMFEEMIGSTFDVLGHRAYQDREFYLLKTADFKPNYKDSVWDSEYLEISGDSIPIETDATEELDRILGITSKTEERTNFSTLSNFKKDNPKRKKLIDIKRIVDLKTDIFDDCICNCGGKASYMLNVHNVPILLCSDCIADLGRTCINILR